jgi:hypothetical protein
MVTSWLARPKSEVMSKLMRESERQLVAANCGWYPGSRKRQKRLMGSNMWSKRTGQNARYSGHLR